MSDYPTKSLRTLLDRSELTDRPRRDVVVALGYVACETNTHTPARVLEAGPWWKAASLDSPTARRHATRGESCARCAQILTDSCCDAPTGKPTINGSPRPLGFATTHTKENTHD